VAEIIESRPVAVQASEMLDANPDADEIWAVVAAGGEVNAGLPTIWATQPTAQRAIEWIDESPEATYAWR
jgi:hypothetical protein